MFFFWVVSMSEFYILTSCNIYFMAANKENENVDIKNKEGMKLAINNHLTINK